MKEKFIWFLIHIPKIWKFARVSITSSINLLFLKSQSLDKSTKKISGFKAEVFTSNLVKLLYIEAVQPLPYTYNIFLQKFQKKKEKHNDSIRLQFLPDK